MTGSGLPALDSTDEAELQIAKKLRHQSTEYAERRKQKGLV